MENETSFKNFQLGTEIRDCKGYCDLMGVTQELITKVRK